mgnify:CR=1 FL=1
MIEIYCDGAASKNGSQNSIGGWAYIVKDQDADSYFHYDCGSKKKATNQQMEITAALEALRHVTSNFLKEYKKIPFCEFVKVQGHSGNKYNEIVDELAVSARLG